jgi:AraC-like DNA-binding protein
MILLPLPFVVALFLAVFAIRYGRTARERGDDALAFIVLMALFAFQSLLVGARWGYGATVLQPFMAAMASLLPPAAFLAFRGLTGGPTRPRLTDWPHAVWPILVTALLVLRRDWVGAVIILDFLFYGGLLLASARGGPDRLVASRLDGVVTSYRALQITGATLIASAVSDMLISLDLVLFAGRYSGAIISFGTTVSLIILSAAAVLVDPARVEKREEENADRDDEAEDAPSSSREASEEDREIAAALDALMATNALYRDMELNLVRLARKLGKTTRAVSRAVNRCHGVSVSQYVNEFRVREAQRLLKETQESVVQIALEAGFMTKSNFNREFLRVSGQSPTDWRRAVASQGA